MKKMFTLLVSLVTFSALFAQYDKPYDNRRRDDRNYQQNDPRNNNNGGGWNNNHQPIYDNGWDHNDPRIINQDVPDYRPDHAIDMRRDDGGWQPDNCRNDHDRRIEMDRINRDYDQRINVYQNDRCMNGWERDHEIDRLQRERNNRLQVFGGGALLGGVLGIIIGSQL